MLGFLFSTFPCPIQAFSERYTVDQDLVVKYIHHLAYLQMIKQKKEEEGRRNQKGKIDQDIRMWNERSSSPKHVH